MTNAFWGVIPYTGKNASVFNVSNFEEKMGEIMQKMLWTKMGKFLENAVNLNLTSKFEDFLGFFLVFNWRDILMSRRTQYAVTEFYCSGSFRQFLTRLVQKLTLRNDCN